MKCPHCGIEIHEAWENQRPTRDDITLHAMNCPACNKCIAKFSHLRPIGFSRWAPDFTEIIFPKFSVGSILDNSIEESFASDYKEAQAVLPLSPKASAALSRRCLQSLLRDKLGVKKADLSKEIEECISKKLLPSELLDMIDEIRHVGNFAVHPIKNTNTSEIVNVEPGEAEACLAILEEMFDFIFVRPARIKERQDKLNAKLGEIGKPEIKKS